MEERDMKDGSNASDNRFFGSLTIHMETTDFHFPSMNDEPTGPGYMNQRPARKKKIYMETTRQCSLSFHKS